MRFKNRCLTDRWPISCRRNRQTGHQVAKQVTASMKAWPRWRLTVNEWNRSPSPLRAPTGGRSGIHHWRHCSRFYRRKRRAKKYSCFRSIPTCRWYTGNNLKITLTGCFELMWSDLNCLKEINLGTKQTFTWRNAKLIHFSCRMFASVIRLLYLKVLNNTMIAVSIQ
jgi:hypothetical protein